MTNDQNKESQSPEDRRRYIRFPYALHVSYKHLQRDFVSEPEARMLEDLGAGGMAMSSSRRLEPGQILMVSLYLPLPGVRLDASELDSYPKEKCKPVLILSRVAWCAPKAGGHYTAGVEFLDLNLNDRIRLKDFLITHHLDQPDSSLYK